MAARHGSLRRRIATLDGAKTLHFNYETDYNKPWAKTSLRNKHDYDVNFPDEDGTFSIDL